MDPCATHFFIGIGDVVAVIAGVSLGLIMGTATLEIWLRRKSR